MHIRREKPEDATEIRRLTDEAFRGVPYSNGKEGEIVDARLRLAGVPVEYFQCLTFGPSMPEGEVAYHSAFNI